MNLLPALQQLALRERRPSARAQWAAFYRLHRLAARRGDATYRSIMAGDAWRVLLWRDWSWLQLVEAPGDRLALPRMSPALRRGQVESDRRRRLRADQMVTT